jgi:hypothetical protein
MEMTYTEFNMMAPAMRMKLVKSGELKVLPDVKPAPVELAEGQMKRSAWNALDPVARREAAKTMKIVD